MLTIIPHLGRDEGHRFIWMVVGDCCAHAPWHDKVDIATMCVLDLSCEHPLCYHRLTELSEVMDDAPTAGEQQLRSAIKDSIS